MWDSLDPAEPLESVDQRRDGAGREHQAVPELAGREAARGEDVVHGLELGRRRVEAAGDDRVEAVVLQAEAAEGGQELGGSCHSHTES